MQDAMNSTQGLNPAINFNKNYTKLPNELLRNIPDISLGARCLLYNICSHIMPNQNYADISNQELIKELGVSANSIRKYKSELINKRFIKISAPHGVFKSRFYLIIDICNLAYCHEEQSSSIYKNKNIKKDDIQPELFDTEIYEPLQKMDNTPSNFEGVESQNLSLRGENSATVMPSKAFTENNLQAPKTFKTNLKQKQTFNNTRTSTVTSYGGIQHTEDVCCLNSNNSNNNGFIINNNQSNKDFELIEDKSVVNSQATTPPLSPTTFSTNSIHKIFPISEERLDSCKSTPDQAISNSYQSASNITNMHIKEVFPVSDNGDLTKAIIDKLKTIRVTGKAAQELATEYNTKAIFDVIKLVSKKLQEGKCYNPYGMVKSAMERGYDMSSVQKDKRNEQKREALKQQSNERLEDLTYAAQSHKRLLNDHERAIEVYKGLSEENKKLIDKAIEKKICKNLGSNFNNLPKNVINTLIINELDRILKTNDYDIETYIRNLKSVMLVSGAR